MDPLSYRIGIYCVLKEYTKFSYVKKKKKFQCPGLKSNIIRNPHALSFPELRDSTVHAVFIYS